MVPATKLARISHLPAAKREGKDLKGLRVSPDSHDHTQALTVLYLPSLLDKLETYKVVRARFMPAGKNRARFSQPPFEKLSGAPDEGSWIKSNL